MIREALAIFAAILRVTWRERRLRSRLMKCTYCGHALLGFSDSRIVKINADRRIACADVEACGRRRAATARARDADFGPDGDATTPGFFRRAGE